MRNNKNNPDKKSAKICSKASRRKPIPLVSDKQNNSSKNKNVKKLPKSIRKYIRKEKARIRQRFFDIEEQEKQISALYQQFR